MSQMSAAEPQLGTVTKGNVCLEGQIKSLAAPGSPCQSRSAPAACSRGKRGECGTFAALRQPLPQRCASRRLQS